MAKTAVGGLVALEAGRVFQAAGNLLVASQGPVRRMGHGEAVAGETGRGLRRPGVARGAGGISLGDPPPVFLAPRGGVSAGWPLGMAGQAVFGSLVATGAKARLPLHCGAMLLAPAGRMGHREAMASVAEVGVVAMGAKATPLLPCCLMALGPPAGGMGHGKAVTVVAIPLGMAPLAKGRACLCC